MAVRSLDGSTFTPSPVFRLSTDTFFAHSRSSMKIQDGCNCQCTYCRIHLARGRAVSLEETGTQIPAREDNVPTLLSAVQALPEAYSAVIHLYYYEGYSIKEIAKLLRLPASTVGTRLARGRERLRRMLKEEMS